MKTSGICALTCGLLAACYLGGVWISASQAPKVTAAVLSEVNGRLSSGADPILSSGGFKASLRMDEDGSFGGRGVVILSSMVPEFELQLPLSLSYGFLNIQASVDLNPLTRRIFVDRGIIRDNVSSAARLALKLVPFNYTVSLTGDAEYVHAPSVRPHVTMRMHRSTFGTESTEVIGQRLMTPVGFISSLHGVSLRNEGEAPSSLELSASGLDLHGSSVDELRGFKAMLRTADRSVSSLAVAAVVKADTVYGQGSARLELGDFSSEDFVLGRMSLPNLIFSPMRALGHFTGEAAHLDLKSLNFNADFETDGENTAYDIDGYGRLTYKTGSFSIRSFNGRFDFRFDNVNSGGERVIDAIGREIFIRDGTGYRTSVNIENGRLSYNGQ